MECVVNWNPIADCTKNGSISCVLVRTLTRTCENKTVCVSLARQFHNGPLLISILMEVADKAIKFDDRAHLANGYHSRISPFAIAWYVSL